MFFPCSSTVSTSYSSQWEHHVWHQKPETPSQSRPGNFPVEFYFHCCCVCLPVHKVYLGQILKFNTKTARLSALVTKHWKLRSNYAQNQETNHAFFSLVHNCLSGTRKTLEQTGIPLVCVLCACTHNRNQTEASGSNNNNNKSKDRWSGMKIRRRKRTCTSTCSSVKDLGSLLLRHIESSLGPKASNSYGLEKQCNAATACCTIISYILFFMVVFCHSPCCCCPFAYPSRTEAENAEPDCSCILVSCVPSLSLSLSLSLARVGTGPGWWKGVFPCTLGTRRALWDSRWHPDAWPDPARPVPGSPFPSAASFVGVIRT